MKRITAMAVALAVVALVALAMPALAQGPMGGNPQNGFGWMGGGMTPALACGASVGGFVPGQAITPTVPYGYSRGGMMGGFVPGQTITPTAPYGYGRGGMMGGFGMTPALPKGCGASVSGFGYGYAPNAKPITVDQAVTNAQQYVTAYNNADLKLVEVEEYTWNFYGVVKEKSTLYLRLSSPARGGS